MPDGVPRGMSQVMVAEDSGDRTCGRCQWNLVLTWLSVYTCTQACSTLALEHRRDCHNSLHGQQREQLHNAE